MMQSYFCHTVQFLQPYFHGRTDRGEPEWPPSPLRVFQALVAAGATRWREKRFSECAAPALFWLEQQCISSIIAPIGQPADTKYRLYVPDNVADKVGKSWSKGGNDNVANHRTEKDIKPIHLRNGDTVYYTFPLAEDHCPHLEILVEAARSITHLGWGVDMVVGNAAVISEEEVAQLTGERWRILDDDSATGYRVPVKGTLDALIEKHNAFLHRIGPDGSFIPVPPLPTSAFRVVGYRRTTDQAARPFAAFSILKPDASGLRSFDSVRQGLRVAGMLRYAAKQVAAHAGLNESQTNRLVLGHGEAKGEPHLPVGPARFAYFPLPSIEFRGEGRAQAVGRIRRVMVASFAENIGTEFAWVRRSLSGQSLIEEESKNAIAMLSLIPQRDKMILPYTQASSCWATVTPVVLPGFDDPRHLRRRLENKVDAAEQKQLLARLDERIDQLLRKAIMQAGFTQELVEHADIDWRKLGFWPGTDHADRYGVPDHLKRFPRYHVQINWRNVQGTPINVPGPICIGGGRFFGLGLFAAIPDQA